MQIAAIRIDRAQWIALATLLLCTVAMAGDNFPGHEPDRRAWNIQEKADDLFDKGDYERAMFIYRKELAPLGDKYAQYMIGFMYLAGKGVAPDLITASAWYRLAAERGDKTLSGERDKLMSLLDDAQKAQSDRAFADLRKEYGDAALVAGLIEEDLELLDERASIIAYRPGSLSGRTYVSREAYVKGISTRINERMHYLSEIVEADDRLGDAEVERYRMLEARVREVLGEL